MTIQGINYSDDPTEYEFREYKNESLFPDILPGFLLPSSGLVFCQIEYKPLGKFFVTREPILLTYMCFN